MTDIRWKKLSLEGDGQGGKRAARITYLSTEITQNQGKELWWSEPGAKVKYAKELGEL